MPKTGKSVRQANGRGGRQRLRVCLEVQVRPNVDSFLEEKMMWKQSLSGIDCKTCRCLATKHKCVIFTSFSSLGQRPERTYLAPSFGVGGPWSAGSIVSVLVATEDNMEEGHGGHDPSPHGGEEAVRDKV